MNFLSTFFLILYDSLVLFSWTQIPADSVFFLLTLLVTYLMAWPWLHDDFAENKDSGKIFLKKEIYYFAILYVFLLLCNASILKWELHWLFFGLFLQLNFSVIIYVFVLIKRKIGTTFSEKIKSTILFILVILNCAMFGGNMYSNYEYIDKATQEKSEVLYMNDKYVLTPEKVLKNDSGLVLKKINLFEE